MSSTGPSATDNTTAENATAEDSSSPNDALSTSAIAIPASTAIAIPASTAVPRSAPIPILPGYDASRPMASSAPGRFTWERGDIDILGTSPPDKGRPKFYKW